MAAVTRESLISTLMDIKRTVLWVVFSLSVLVLWDNWMRYSGQPSMFFPTATQPAKPAAGAGAAGAKSDVPQASTSGAAPAVTPATPAAGGTTLVPSERITITTDLVKADIDTVGGELKHLELLKHKDTIDPNKNMV